MVAQDPEHTIQTLENQAKGEGREEEIVEKVTIPHEEDQEEHEKEDEEDEDENVKDNKYVKGSVKKKGRYYVQK